MRALLHEWFVTYNPIYLASATLVLGGLWLVWRDLGSRAALGGVGVAVVAELYALALIGSAAVLRPIGQQRVAVMLGLLAALYQCDVTLLLETCSFLGTIGALASLAWLALFALKLRLLERALDLRLSRSARWVPIAGAAMVALLPQIFRVVAIDARGPLAAIAVFVVGAAALWTSRSIECRGGFDYRGRRAVRGVEWLWAVMALLHVAYWGLELGVSLAPSAPVAPLLATRFVARERSVWFAVLATIGAVALLDPSLLSVTALMAAAVLALRALRASAAHRELERPSSPYRAPFAVHPAITDLAAPRVCFEAAAPIARERLLLGAAFCLHLSASTFGARDLWVVHHPLLDLGLLAICAGAFWRGRRPQSLAPLAPVGLHGAVSLGWLTMPRGAVEWGAWSIAAGFVSLGVAVATSLHLHRTASSGGRSHAGS